MTKGPGDEAGPNQWDQENSDERKAAFYAD